MAAGLSRKQRNARVYNRLRAIGWKLERQGVTSAYKRFQLCAETTGLDAVGGFNIRYTWSFASNGECAGFQVITVHPYAEASEYYGWQQPNGTAEQGLNRIVELFSRLAPEQRPNLKF